MDPSVEELNKMGSVVEMFKWIGVGNALKEALDATMSEITQFRQIVLCPAPVWQAAVNQLRVIMVKAVPPRPAEGTAGQPGHVPAVREVVQVDRPLNVVEASQVASIRRVARMRCNEKADEDVPAQFGQVGGGGPQASALPPSMGLLQKGGARVSEVADQTDHAEVAPWDQPRVRTTMKVYTLSNKGVAAKNRYTPTALQFAALEYKLRTTGSAYVDFGVFRPNGGRLERRMRMTIHARNLKGDWIPFEIAGPACFAEWQQGWRVFVVAMRGMAEADQPPMNEYEHTIQDLVETFGEACWWIIAQGDGRMRSEHMPRMLSQALDDKEEVERKGGVHPLDLRRPWDYLFLAASRDRDFWADEVKDKCTRWLTRIEGKESIADEGFGVVRPGNSGLEHIQAAAMREAPRATQGAKRKAEALEESSSEEPAAKRKSGKNKKRKGARAAAKKQAKARPKAKADPPKRGGQAKNAGGGLHKNTAAGKQICFAWARSGNCREPCPNDRAHVCEKCLMRHKTAECTD